MFVETSDKRLAFSGPAGEVLRVNKGRTRRYEPAPARTSNVILFQSARLYSSWLIRYTL